MTDEVGQHLRISLTVWMTGAFLSVVVGVAVLSLLVFRNYTGKYSDTMVQATSSSMYALAAQHSVTCPQAYATITASISEVDRVIVKMEGDASWKVYYDYKDPDSDRMISLMTGVNATKNVRMTIEQSTRTSSMITIKLVEVVR